MPNKKVVCYARVSTADQTPGLESQVRVLKQYCDSNSNQQFEFFTDGGISGTKASRPALDRLMAAVEADAISAVVVYSFSRFARSTTHLLQTLQIFQKKMFTSSVSPKKSIGTQQWALAIFSILAAISQLERDLIANRVKIGRG